MDYVTEEHQAIVFLDVINWQKKTRVVPSPRAPTPEPPLSPTAPPPHTQNAVHSICARPVYVEAKQRAVKTVFIVVRLFAAPAPKTRGQRGGNLVGQTPRILDPVDNLQARFPAWNSHSSHLRLLKTQVEADPSSQAHCCRLHDNASAWRAFVVSTIDVGFSFPALDQHKPEQEAPGEAHARVLAGIKASWPRPRWEEWHHSWSTTWSVSAGGVDSGQIWVIDPLRGSQAVIIRPKIKFTHHLSCQLKLFSFLFPFARTGYCFIYHSILQTQVQSSGWVDGRTELIPQ